MAEIKKKWVKIISPKLLDNTEVGETLCSDANKLLGRVIEVNIGSLANDVKRQHMKLRLKINEIKGEQAHTEIVGYNTVQAHIKRAVRKERSKIEDSFKVELNDKIKAIIKPMIITRFETKNSVLAQLMKKGREFCIETCKKISYEELITFIINNKFQRDMKQALKKIYPLAICEIKTVIKL